MEEQPPINLLKPRSPLDNPPQKQSNLNRIIIILAFVILAGGFFVARSYSVDKWPESASSYDPITLKPKKAGLFESVKNFILDSDNVVQGQKDDRINILVLGIGGSGHDGPYLSDTNIILSVKPSTNQVAMISIPRDLAVSIDEYGLRKINNADAFGEMKEAGYGGEYARQIFEKTFGIEIPYYVRVDFKAFQELVDIVGGVDINVEKSFTDASYPGENYSYQTITFLAGEQTMDGEKALKFARSRHGNNGEGSDFARAKRQQLVIGSLKEKLLSPGIYLNPIRIQQILSTLSNNITTNLDFGQIMYLAGLAKQIDGQIDSLVLDDSENGYLKSMIGDQGAYLLAPKAGDFSEINGAIVNIFDENWQKENATMLITEISETATITPKKNIEIQNGTWILGLASRTKQRLEDQNLSVLAIGNTVKKPIATTTIYLINQEIKSEELLLLQNTMNMAAISDLPDWLSDEYDNPETSTNEQGPKYNMESDVLIILGEDAQQ